FMKALQVHIPDSFFAKRAEMAAVTNRAFGATKQADLKGFSDVPATKCYFADMGKAVQMKTLGGVNSFIVRGNS
ncbi:MAG: hypothetical protein RSG55_08540, partial [Oscillospiraceae bacterium]